MGQVKKNKFIQNIKTIQNKKINIKIFFPAIIFNLFFEFDNIQQFDGIGPMIKQ